MYYGREWLGITPENFMQHVDAYIRRYNERRINYRSVLSAQNCTVGNSVSHNKTVQENIRIPDWAKIGGRANIVNFEWGE